MKVINKGEKFQNIKDKKPCKIKYCEEYVLPSQPKLFKLYCRKFCWGGYTDKDTISEKESG